MATTLPLPEEGEGDLVVSQKGVVCGHGEHLFLHKKKAKVTLAPLVMVMTTIHSLPQKMKDMKAFQRRNAHGHDHHSFIIQKNKGDGGGATATPSQPTQPAKPSNKRNQRNETKSQTIP